MKQKQKYFTGGAPIKFGGGVPMGMQQQPGGNLMESLVGLLGGGPAGGGVAAGFWPNQMGNQMAKFQGGGGGGGIMEVLKGLLGGGGGMQGGGGPAGAAAGGWQGLAQLLNGPQPQKQAMTNYQQVGIGGPIGGIEFPGADLEDRIGGPAWARAGWDPGWTQAYNAFNQLGMPWSPTMIPTTYDPQGYPYAVPNFTPAINQSGAPGSPPTWELPQ